MYRDERNKNGEGKGREGKDNKGRKSDSSSSRVVASILTGTNGMHASLAFPNSGLEPQEGFACLQIKDGIVDAADGVSS